MTKYSEFKKALKIVNDYKAQHENKYKEVINTITHGSKFAKVTKDMKVHDVDCSLRLLNSLYTYYYQVQIKFNHDTKISELSNISIKEFARQRNIGKLTVDELKEMCLYAKVSLKP